MGQDAAIDTQVAVVGGGVVGLSIAIRLASEGSEVVLVERGDRCGSETSTRNNQVVHAGFLYPHGSLKARLCRPGRDALLAYAAARGVPHRLAPKLMPVIGPEQAELLHMLISQGRSAGVGDLSVLDRPALERLEPALRAHAAILSPSTAIIDAAALVNALEADAENAGVVIVRRTLALSGTVGLPHILQLRSAGEPARLQCRWLVNAAGLGAADLARALTGFDPARVPTIHHAKGQFLSHAGTVPFRHLVVPAEPELLSAGASLTFDIDGRSRFGPDLGFVEGRSYATTATVPATALDAIACWWPDVRPERLAPEFAGIRPRVTGHGRPPGDWRIDGPGKHGIPGVIHLFGIDTPGLTACLAIAEHVAELMWQDRTQSGSNRR